MIGCFVARSQFPSQENLHCLPFAFPAKGGLFSILFSKALTVATLSFLTLAIHVITLSLSQKPHTTNFHTRYCRLINFGRPRSSNRREIEETASRVSRRRLSLRGCDTRQQE